MADEISIFSYTDYRQFLRDMYQSLKTQNPNFSHRRFSQLAGFASPNVLKVVMDGNRNLSHKSIHRFSQALKLNAKERRFFELLVHYNQAPSQQQARHYYQQLMAVPESHTHQQLAQEQYDYMSQWFYPAIAELANLEDFKEDPLWIAHRLQKKLTPTEASEALVTLQNIGLLARDDKGRLRPAHPSITTGPEVATMAAFRFYEQGLELAKAALNRQPEDWREFGTIVTSVSANQIAKLKELIRDFRKTVVHYLSQEPETPSAVCQVNVQMFTLTAIDAAGARKVK